MSEQLLPPPNQLGAPPEYDSWRAQQDLSVLRNLDRTKRFTGQCRPTGSGKSLEAIVTASLYTGRVLILVANKGQEDQMVEDFQGQLVDIRGVSNYTCDMGHDFPFEYEMWKREAEEGAEPGCDVGPCHYGRTCTLKDFGGCSYYGPGGAIARARRARVVLSNYACWMAHARFSEMGLGKFDLILADEAHEAPNELSKFLRTEISQRDLDHAGLGLEIKVPKSEKPGLWAEWASQALSGVDHLLVQIEQDPSRHKEKRRIQEVRGKLQMLSTMRHDWVLETGEYGSKAWEPKWPGQYAEKYLWCDTPRIILYSATMRPKTLDLLGIKEGDRDFYEYPSMFPAGRRPVIHVPTIRLNAKTQDDDLWTWLQTIDRIVEARGDRKGIIHTVSYDRAELIRCNTRFLDRMLWNDPKNGLKTADVVKRFKEAGPGAILLSPSVDTGYDFPYDQCEYQIIGKLPYPSPTPLSIARAEDDKEYQSYIAMIKMVQAAGRGMRAPDDMCETLIIDDSVRWFIKQYRHLAPGWFLSAFIWGAGQDGLVIPHPLPKLEGRGV